MILTVCKAIKNQIKKMVNIKWRLNSQIKELIDSQKVDCPHLNNERHFSRRFRHLPNEFLQFRPKGRSWWATLVIRFMKMTKNLSNKHNNIFQKIINIKWLLESPMINWRANAKANQSFLLRRLSRSETRNHLNHHFLVEEDN